MIPLTTNGLGWSIHVLPSHICRSQYTHHSAKWSSITAFLSGKTLHDHLFHAWNSRYSTFNNHDSFSHHAAHNTIHAIHKQPTMNDKQCTSRIVPFRKSKASFHVTTLHAKLCARQFDTFQIDTTSIHFQFADDFQLAKYTPWRLNPFEVHWVGAEIPLFTTVHKYTILPLAVLKVNCLIVECRCRLFLCCW